MTRWGLVPCLKFCCLFCFIFVLILAVSGSTQTVRPLLLWNFTIAVFTHLSQKVVGMGTGAEKQQVEGPSLGFWV